MLLNDKPIIPKALDDIFKDTKIGSIAGALTNELYGINHQLIPKPVLTQKDQRGILFVVRPQLNLSSDNIRNIRRFYGLLTSESKSIQRYVRTVLDPRLPKGYKGLDPLVCPLLDPDNAFIVPITNFSISMSGAPDPVLPTYTSAAGRYKEEYVQVDGSMDIYNSYDMDISFTDTVGNPLLLLFYVWEYYMSYVFEGLMTPYMDYVIGNIIDYTTRIYYFTFTSDKRYISKVFATGVSFPVSISLGQFFNFNRERPIDAEANKFTVRFKSIGAQYMDDILLKEFNKTVAIHNGNMRDGVRESNYMKIPTEYLRLLNNRGYPYVNVETKQLEWWAPKEVVRQLFNRYDKWGKPKALSSEVV